MVSSIGMRPRKVGFSVDSPLEGEGFEPSVPPRVSSVVPPRMRSRPRTSCLQILGAGAAVQVDLFCSTSHSMEPGAGRVWVGCGLRRCSACCCSNLWRESS